MVLCLYTQQVIFKLAGVICGRKWSQKKKRRKYLCCKSLKGQLIIIIFIWLTMNEIWSGELDSEMPRSASD